MRWAIIGASEFDSLEYHLGDSLRHLGHEFASFDLTLAGGKGKTAHYWLRRFSDSYDRKKATEVAHRILDYKPDVVMGVYRYIHPLTIEIIKKKSPSTIAIHFNPDQMVTLEQQQIIASPYDYYFTKDPFMQRFMKDMAGLNAHYLPESFNQRVHIAPQADRSIMEKEVGIEVLVFGSMYPYRLRIVDQLIKAGVKVSLLGSQSRFFNSAFSNIFNHVEIRGEGKSKILFGSKIVLNCFHYAEVEGVNCKYFEINGIGGFQLCDYRPILKEYSPVAPGRYSYSTIDQAIELIRYYLPKPEERFEIAEIQRKHFLDNHTYDHRIKSIIEIIQKD